METEKRQEESKESKESKDRALGSVSRKPTLKVHYTKDKPLPILKSSQNSNADSTGDDSGKTNASANNDQNIKEPASAGVGADTNSTTKAGAKSSASIPSGSVAVSASTSALAKKATSNSASTADSAQPPHDNENKQSEIQRRPSSLSFTEPSEIAKSRRGSISTRPSNVSLATGPKGFPMIGANTTAGSRQPSSGNIGGLVGSSGSLHGSHGGSGTHGATPKFDTAAAAAPVSHRSSKSLHRQDSDQGINFTVTKRAESPQPSAKPVKAVIQHEDKPLYPFTQYFTKTDDEKVHVLLGATGSVATIKIPEIIDKIYSHFTRDKVSIQLVITKCAEHFLKGLRISSDIKIWRDQDEWFGYNNKDPILHVELRKWADIFVVTPVSANTLAKISNGIADNLLTSIFRVWNPAQPIVIAPAMNTYMYTHPVTKLQLKKLNDYFPWIKVLKPVEKVLVCGDIGMGGMTTVQEIVMSAKKELAIFKTREDGSDELGDVEEEENEENEDDEEDDDQD